jgi:predicted transcriptional regulator
MEILLTPLQDRILTAIKENKGLSIFELKNEIDIKDKRNLLKPLKRLEALGLIKKIYKLDGSYKLEITQAGISAKKKKN